jgi:3-oxoacyl-(acyl-carrier-protein) synthase
VEVRGQFMLEGWVQMALIMGCIKHFDCRLKNGSLYVGWALHPSEVGLSLGSGMGGIVSLQRMFKDHREEVSEVQNNVLQETYCFYPSA